MQASIITGKASPDKLDDVIRYYKQFIVPALQEQTGCKGVVLLFNPDTRHFVAITFWATLANRLAAEASAYLQTQMRQVGLLLERPFITEHYLVNTSETDNALQ